MKIILFLIVILLGVCPVKGQVFYRGLERMCWTNSKGKIECYDSPRKWYHENTILIERDSIFIYKVPVRIAKGKKLYSASDGAFFYDYGVIKKEGLYKVAHLTRHNCEYCGKIITIDSLTGFRYPVPSLSTLELKFEQNGINIKGVVYKKIKVPSIDYFFPAKSSFYLDSNSIYRPNPVGQYRLISQGIKSFLRTKELKLDGDTLRICLDRFEVFEKDKLIETLNPNLLKIDTTGIIFKYYSRSQVDTLVKYSKKPIRVIMVEDITEYWKAARISFIYKIFLPQSVHGFSEREYNNTFGYTKIGQSYKHIGRLPENSWARIDKK